MELYTIRDGALVPVPPRPYAELSLREADLQALVVSHPSRFLPADVLLIGQEVRVSEDGRCDVLGVHRNGDLHVAEIKRVALTGYEMLQPLYYALHLQELPWGEAVRIFAAHLVATGETTVDSAQELAESRLLAHLGWDVPRTERFAVRCKVTFIAPDVRAPFLSAISRANALAGGAAHEIRCVRARVHPHAGAVLLGVEQLVPLVEAAELDRRRARRAGEVICADLRRGDAARDGAGGREALLFRLERADGTVETGLSFRRLVLCAVHAAVGAGATVADVRRVWARESGIFEMVPGRLVGDALAARIVAQRTAAGETPGGRFAERFFVGADEVFHEGDATFALTTEWRRPEHASFVTALVSRYPGALRGYRVEGVGDAAADPGSSEPDRAAA